MLIQVKTILFSWVQCETQNPENRHWCCVTCVAIDTGSSGSVGRGPGTSYEARVRGVLGGRVGVSAWPWSGQGWCSAVYRRASCSRLTLTLTVCLPRELRTMLCDVSSWCFKTNVLNKLPFQLMGLHGGPKMCQFTFAHIFANYWSIFKILLLAHSADNLQ